jgi:hypothetical protein
VSWTLLTFASVYKDDNSPRVRTFVNWLVFGAFTAQPSLKVLTSFQFTITNLKSHENIGGISDLFTTGGLKSA